MTGKAIAAMLLAVFSGPLILGVMALVSLVMSWPLLWAWNYAVPKIFGLPALGYWDAFCLTVVSHLLIRNANTIKAGD